jgi:hypothetical protein
MLVSARKHREALEKVPDKSRPCPIRKFGLQHFTVGSPQPFSGCDTKRSEIRQNERDDSASVSPISDRNGECQIARDREKRPLAFILLDGAKPAHKLRSVESPIFLGLFGG